MNIPKLPTDNLYKFVAVSGLVLSGAISIFIGFVHGQVWSKEQVLTMKLDILVVESRSLRGETATLEVNLKKEDEVGVDSGWEKEQWELYQKEQQELLERKTQFEIKVKTIEYEKRQLKMLTNFLWLATPVGILAYFVFFTLSFWGFYCWYFKSQKQLDKLLIKKLKIN
ncbi:hypothetical protein L6250_03050 [Candidatus Parcubacteria bacterium]|nr:hypothetical protein [Candidatus Parcubacteria bacterium]